jgi:enamine deaminase RidA (YjgF/YER057c/UK114 family)
MPVTLMNPDGLMRTDLYSQVAVATGARQVYVAGQVAYDADGRLVAPGDLAGQVAQAYRNVATALSAAGATLDDVVRLTIYVAGWSMAMMPDFVAGMERAAAELGRIRAPASLIGVTILFDPAFLVEIEATAVVE